MMNNEDLIVSAATPGSINNNKMNKQTSYGPSLYTYIHIKYRPLTSDL